MVALDNLGERGKPVGAQGIIRVKKEEILATDTFQSPVARTADTGVAVMDGMEPRIAPNELIDGRPTIVGASIVHTDDLIVLKCLCLNGG